MILILDNYDSFTYNIYQIVAEHNENTKVYRNNEITIFHGKTSLVEHNNHILFNEVPSPFNAMRYHSLVITEESLNDDFEKIAWTKDGLIMGISHKEFKLYGIQFHPESIGTDFGEQILFNFLSI